MRQRAASPEAIETPIESTAFKGEQVTASEEIEKIEWALAYDPLVWTCETRLRLSGCPFSGGSKCPLYTTSRPSKKFRNPVQIPLSQAKALKR